MQFAALQSLLDAEGVSSTANHLNEAACLACKSKDCDALWTAKGGCFAKISMMKGGGDVCWAPARPYYGLYALPGIDDEGQGGQTLVDLAIEYNWDDNVLSALRQFGVRRSSKPYTFKIYQLETSD